MEKTEVKTQTLAWSQSLPIVFIKFAGLVAVATSAPLIKNQIITGSLVNATLYLGVWETGLLGAFLVGTLPSLIALQIGLLPGVMMPMIPFIILANSLLSFLFFRLEESSVFLRIIIASISKFAFLFLSSRIVINLMSFAVPEKVAQMMSWPQLITALSGGILAFFIAKGLKKNI